MKNHYIDVETRVSVDVQEVIDDLEYDDVYDWIGALSPKEKLVFVEDLADCFNDVDLAELMGAEWSLEEALDTVVKAWQNSPYDRDKIKDRLKTDGVLLE